MKLSTKGRYGTRVMLELALRHGNGPVQMSIIAQNQEISRKYIHSLLTSLQAAGLVRSIRGAGGGYVLAKEPSRILVSDIVRALEGEFKFVDCVGDASICGRVDVCATRDVWMEVGEAIERVLSAITLEDLVARQQSKASQVATYQI